MTLSSLVNDVVIIGGGVAGASAAIWLARAGCSVTLMEKEKAAHDKVCGEFLSREAIRYLNELGLDLKALGALPIDRLRFAGATRRSEMSLPFAACSLSRRTLDEALLQRAAQLGVRVERGRRVDRIEEIQARHVVLATGKYNLHGFERGPGRQNLLLGFKMQLRLRAEAHVDLARRIDLAVFPGGYCGLQQIENGLANLALLIDRGVFARDCRHWPAVLPYLRKHCAHLEKLLQDAECAWSQPLAVSNIPYGYLCAAEERVWRVGDQAAVIPSFAGNGISIALHTARLASEAIIKQESPARYYDRIRRELANKLRLATLLSRGIVDRRSRAPLTCAARWFPMGLNLIARATRIAN